MTPPKPPTLQLALLVALSAVVTLGAPQLMACDSSRASAAAPEADTSNGGPTPAATDTRDARGASPSGAQALTGGRPSAPTGRPPAEPTANQAGTRAVAVGVAPPSAPQFAVPAETRPVSASAGLGVRRLVVAHEVVDREPVVRDQVFEAGQDRVFAFVEARNTDADAGTIRIYFEGPDGQRVGDIDLEVPAAQRRWRTWGYSRNVTAPGTWEAVVVDEAGRVLAREAFEVR